jgi:biotin/methionine sulfoxide reductase
MKQAIAPQGEARDDHAIFAGLAARLGVEQGFTEGLDEAGWLRRIYEANRAQVAAFGIVLPPLTTSGATG